MSSNSDYSKPRVIRYGASDAIYGLGLVGAWVYFIGHAPTFWLGVIGFVKGIFWPAFMVFEAFRLLYKG